MTVLDTHDDTGETDGEATAGRASGNWNPSWEPFAKLDPSWTEKVIALAIAPAVSGALDTKTVELVRIALDASCVHLNAPGIRRHIRRALQAGATKAEITAVLQIASLQGLESVRVGAPILLEELQADNSRQPRHTTPLAPHPTTDLTQGDNP